MSSNFYRALISLLPQRPLMAGVVIAYGNGVATIEVPGGGRYQARGDAAVDDHVFFRDNAIEGPAPDLPVEIIEL